MNLAGKTALVTGGSRGIGAAIAKRLADDGAKVVITWSTSGDRALELIDRINTNGGQAIALQADSGNPDDLRQAVAKAVEHWGRLDILVNNAGIATMVPVDDFDESDFDRLIAVNIKGVYVAAQAAARHMKTGSRIINIGSVNAQLVPFPGMTVYAMSKAAVATFTRGFARELGPRGITVNNIQPGPIDTEMNPADTEFANTIRRIMAVPRYGSAEEIAGLVAYLASEEAAFVTGASWNIDGGFGL